VKDAGSLKPGNVADLIAVQGDPLSDVKTLQAIDFVMKSGTVAKQNGTMLDGMSYPAFGSDRARR
ncbi:MAG: hypothetical protein JNM81_11990, partial [Rhodospirillaceae bacterium]|nr:hypothetical protein [Rhodospirillaceae bacterium]